MGKLAGSNKPISWGGVAAVCALALGGGTLAVGGKLAANRSNVAQMQADALESPGDFKAFIVGASDYDDELGLSDLDFVQNDVESLAARFIEIGFKKENVVVLKSGGDFKYFPTKKNIEKRYRKFLDSLQKGDFVVVYLSGHGIQATGSEEAFFAPSDVEPKDWFGTSISINNMLTDLDESVAKFRWMIVDACRNDPFFRKTKAIGVKGLTDIVNAPETTAFLQSCQPGEFSYGVDGISVFTLSLLEAFDEKKKLADANDDGAVAFSEAYKYVQSRTADLAQQCYGVSQKPDLNCKIPDFVILEAGNESPRLIFVFLSGTVLCAVLAVGVWKIKAEIAKKKKKTETGVDDEKGVSRDAERELAIETSETQDDVGDKGKRRVSLLTSQEEAVEKAFDETKRKLRRALKEALVKEWDGKTAGAQRSFDVRGVTYDFRYCPPNYFLMGSLENELGRDRDETLRHVKVNAFWMLETPVTQKMWESIMGAGASWSTVGSNPSWFSATGGGKDKIQGIKDALNLPVDSVSWYDCQNFIENLNAAIAVEDYPKNWKFRLPKESEWEYACRAGSTTPFSWGTALNGDEANCNGNYPYTSLRRTLVKPGAFLERTSEPRSYKPNPWGLYDMHGNVCEWCEDSRWSVEFEAALNKNTSRVFDAIMAFGTEEKTSVKRVLRGGGWDDGACNCRAAFRRYCDPTVRRFSFGFRLVLDCGEEARG